MKHFTTVEKRLYNKRASFPQLCIVVVRAHDGTQGDNTAARCVPESVCTHTRLAGPWAGQRHNPRDNDATCRSAATSRHTDGSKRGRTGGRWARTAAAGTRDTLQASDRKTNPKVRNEGFHSDRVTAQTQPVALLPSPVNYTLTAQSLSARRQHYRPGSAKRGPRRGGTCLSLPRCLPLA